MIHAAAFQNQTLGNPKFCPLENTNRIDSKVLYSYMKTHYRPERIVLACVGIDHDQFVEMSEDIFSKTTPIWNENPSLLDPKYENIIETSKAVWTGGSCINTRKIISQNQMPELVHVVVGLESKDLI
jgi:processing peptidase subunit alpha